MVDVESFLQRNLIGFQKDETGGYCFGKYIGCSKALVEGFLAVSSGSFVCMASHARGKSKRFKSGSSSKSTIYFQQINAAVPITFSGYPFEITHTEKWICNEASPSTKRHDNQDTETKKRKMAPPKCTASIHVRTARVYNEFSILKDDELSEHEFQKVKDQAKEKLLKVLLANESTTYTDIHYCRFPLDASHENHENISRSNSTQLDKQVIKKIRDLAKNGISDISSIQSMITDFVMNTIFGHAEEKDKPKLDNPRYFPTPKTIRNHIFLGVGKVANIPGYCSKKEITADVSQPQTVTNIIELVTPNNSNISPKKKAMGVGFIAIHAGAGFHSDERWPGYKHLCMKVCDAVSTRLNQGMLAGEAVRLAVQMLEDSELTNAGYGSNLTETGHVECDACVMDTSPSQNLSNHRDSYFGAIACVGKIKNPVCAAYKILSERRKRSRLELGRIPPSFLVSSGAELWAKAHGIEMCEANDLISESAMKSWQKYHRRLLEKLTRTGVVENLEGESNANQRIDTVGAVALDLDGNVASAASSGGILLKMPGRVGQPAGSFGPISSNLAMPTSAAGQLSNMAAIYGCGCWAEPGGERSPSVAVTSSGCGEQLVSTMLSKKCADRLRVCDQPFQALHDAIAKDFLDSPMLNAECDKQAGLLCLHHSDSGLQNTVEVVWGHTTASMVIGHMSTTDKHAKVVLSRLPNNATPGKSLTVGGSWTKLTSSHEEEMEPCTTEHEATMTNGTQDIDSLITGSLDGVNDPQNSNDDTMVDSDIDIMFASPLAEGITQSACKVVLSSEYHRKVDMEFEKNIEKRWKERLQQNPRLFNAQKFRIHSVQYTIDNNVPQLTFHLGLTCYRDYMETNWANEVMELKSKGATEFGQTQAYLAEPLGVAAIVLTDDEQAIFQWRNSWVAESAGQLDVPGGHPEPSAAARVNMQTFITLDNLTCEDVLHEIFYSQVKEVRDEVNVPIEKISDPILMGLVRNNLSGGRAVAYFLMRCHMNKEEVLACYRRGGPETDESTNLHFLPEKEIADLQSAQPDLWKKMCPNSKAACTLYKLLKE